MSLLQMLCGSVGHTWECWRLPDLTVIGYQCAHCRLFSKERPGGLLSRYYE